MCYAPPINRGYFLHPRAVSDIITVKDKGENGGIYMAQEIEIEYKNLLTKQEFDRLNTEFPFPRDAKRQTNYYFETEDFALKANGSALRIREKNDMYHLTLKEPHPDGLLETHDILTKQEATDWLNGKISEKRHTGKQLKDMGISSDSLIYRGSLITERREVAYGQVLLVLDHSFYNGKSDYELELEAPDEATGRKMFDKILAAGRIPKRVTPNKIQRFFSSL
jgi:uncharacterized protein YjbK